MKGERKECLHASVIWSEKPKVTACDHCVCKREKWMVSSSSMQTGAWPLVAAHAANDVLSDQWNAVLW